MPDILSQRKLFSMIGHYPVAGWLRVACSYIKRQACSQGTQWEDVAGEEAVQML